jgi:type VI secretion system protein ImpL
MQTLQQQSVTLPSGLRKLVSDIDDATGGTVVKGATSEIEDLYTQQIQPPCRSLITGKYPFANSGVDVQLTDFGAVFGFDGLFDKFFADHLAKQVDTTGPTWTWRPGSITPQHELLPQFQAAQQIRDMFFQPGSKAPSLKFFVGFSDVDSTATRFILQVDGQNFDDQHGRQQVAWPGTQPGAATTSWESRYYDPTRAYTGPWAVFRLIDDTRMALPDPQSVVLNIRNRYHSVRVTLQPTSAGGNPFTSGIWRQFSCES